MQNKLSVKINTFYGIGDMATACVVGLMGYLIFGGI